MGAGSGRNRHHAPGGRRPGARVTGATLLRSGVAAATVLAGLAGATLAGLATATPAAANSCPVQVINGTGGIAGSGELVVANTTTPTAPVSGDNWSNCNLGTADLAGDNFTGVNITGVNFAETNLSNANLSGEDAHNDTFASQNSGQGQTNLSGADLSGANLDGSDFADDNLTDADLQNATVTENIGVSVGGFYSANVSNADFSGADLTGNTFEHAIVTGAQFANATLTNVSSGEINIQLGVPVSGSGPPASLPADWLFGGTYNAGYYLLGPTADLYLADLPPADLDGVDLAGADLDLTAFNGDSMVGAVFTGATFSDTAFSGCNLTGADFVGDTVYASFASTDLNTTDFQNDVFTRIGSGSGGNSGTPTDLPAPWVLEGGYLLGPTADLEFADLAGFNLAGIDLSGAELAGVSSGGVTGNPTLPTDWTLVDGYLVGPGAELNGANLAGADLAGADLAGTDLTNADLINADLAGASLSGADVGGTALAGADLTGVSSGGGVSGTPASLPAGWSLVGGYLVGPGANLTGAFLNGANLTGADLVRADLTGADLDGATITGANFEGATWSGTTCTDGTDSDADGGTCPGAASAASPAGSSPTQTTTATAGGVAAQAEGGTPADTVTASQYGSDPVGSLADATGDYFDVAVSQPSGFSQVTITDCNANITSAAVIEWYDSSASTWDPVVVAPGDTAPLYGQTQNLGASPPCVSAVVSATSSPTLSQLTGTVFGDAVPPGGPGGTLIPYKASGLIGNYADKVSGAGWGANHDTSVTFYECTTFVQSADCSTGLGTTTVVTAPASKAGDIATVVTVPAGTIDGAGDTCGVAGSPQCYLVAVGSTADSSHAALQFALPSLSVKKTTGVVGNAVEAVTAKNFPIGATVDAMECDNAVTVSSLDTNCDSATQISGTAGPTGSVAFSPAGVTMGVGSDYSDQFGDACSPGGTCALGAVDAGDAAVSAVSGTVTFAVPTVTVRKSAAVLGNYVDAVTAKNFPVGDTVTAWECDGAATTATASSDCDGSSAIEGTAGTNGSVTFSPAGITMRIGAAYGDPASGACNPGGTCLVVAADQGNPAVAAVSGSVTFATPTVTLSPTTVANGNGKTITVAAKNFPIGDTVYALECDSTLAGGSRSQNCDGATTIEGTVGSSGSVAFSPTKLTVLSNDTTTQYSDSAGGTCLAGGPACAVAVYDGSNASLSFTPSFTIG